MTSSGHESLAQLGLASVGQGELADFAPESVIVADLEGIIRYWNPASEALYGWPALAAVGRNIAELSPRKSLHLEQWRQLMHEGIWEGAVRRSASTGTHVSALVRQSVRYDSSGQAIDVVEYGHHIERQAERSILTLEAGWQSPSAACWEVDISGARHLIDALADLRNRGIEPALSQHPQWVEEVLSATHIVDVNLRAVRLVAAAVGREQMIGQPIARYWPAQSRVDLAELIADIAAAQTNAIRTRKIQSLLLSDPTLTVWRSTKPGPADMLFVAVNGIASSERSLWHLKASEKRYRNLIHHLPIPLLQVDGRRMGEVFERLKAEGVLDLDTYIDQHPALMDLAKEAVQITEANQQAAALFGAGSAADLIGPVGLLFEASPETVRHLMLARFNCVRTYSEIVRVRTFDGGMRDVKFSVTYPSSTEELDVTLICLEDMTDRLRAEAQLSRLQGEFTHAARVSILGELTTSIAHEVNQPLAAILTNADTSLRWLSREAPNVDKARQLIGRIVTSAERASEIVQRVKGMAAKNQPERIPLDLGDLIEEALLLIRHDIESRSILLSNKWADGLPEVAGDRVQLQQVIINLLVNAIQAISLKEGPRRIDLATSVDPNGAVVFSIHDSGPGIADENLEHIFDNFFTTKKGGVGIGLAICQSIIIAHGGGITASNHPKGGALFKISLPATQAQLV